MAGSVEHPRVAVGLQAGEGAEAARLDFHRIERTVLDRRDARVRSLVLRVALLAVERCGAATERRVFTVACVPVEFRHGADQALRVDAAGLRQFLDGRTTLEVAIAHMRPHRQRRRTRIAEAVATLETVVADQPGADLFALRHRLDHRRNIVVVTVGLVDEALAVGQHADDSRLAALDDVREMADAAVAVRHPGYWRPGHR
ncbi:hypothetical protein D3C81_1343570 [compost metagenome]